MSMRSQSRAGFTLVELLVVIAVVALLVAIAIPSLAVARRSSKKLETHHDLRQIRTALSVYQLDHAEKIPPTRAGCSTRISYELPPELAEGGMLPQVLDDGVVRVSLRDPWTGDQYRFRAPGPMIMNEFSLLTGAQGSKIWVPDEFPKLTGPGRYHQDPSDCPVLYAVWSMGPDPEAPKLLDNPGRAPVPSKYWMTGAGDDGIITHIVPRRGQEILSP